MRKIWSFHVVVWQRTATKYTKIYNARAQLLFVSLNLLFGDVPVAVAVVVCLSSLKTLRRRQQSTNRRPSMCQYALNMTFKLSALKGKPNADKSLVCHGLPLFQWGNLREKEEPIGRGSFGLVIIARNGNGEKVVIKKPLSEDDQEKRLFIKEAKILHGINSEHIVKFKAVCMEPCAMILIFVFRLRSIRRLSKY